MSNQPNPEQQRLEQQKKMLEMRKKSMDTHISEEDYIKGMIQRIEQFLQGKRTQIEQLKLDHENIMLDIRGLTLEKNKLLGVLRKMKKGE